MLTAGTAGNVVKDFSTRMYDSEIVGWDKRATRAPAHHGTASIGGPASRRAGTGPTLRCWDLHQCLHSLIIFQLRWQLSRCQSFKQHLAAGFRAKQCVECQFTIVG